MSAEQFVVLGLARVRSAWFTEVSRWATAGAAPLEFVKCISPEEVRARLASGRAFSALLVDGALPALDRDLVETARSQGCAVIAVDDGMLRRDFAAIGVSAVVPEPLDRRLLMAALSEHAQPVHPLGETIDLTGDGDGAGGWRGQLVAVLGAGGAGASTIAMAAAQGLASDARLGGRVLLADLALDADQAMLHDVGDVVPGLQELVDAHRSGRPAPEEVRAMTFAIADRGYDLLLGLRRHRDWSALRPRATAAALDALRRAYKVTVADVAADLEGQDECGSADVEDRNLLARTTTATADVVLVVIQPTVVGLQRMTRLLDALFRHGVGAHRILPTINRAPRQGRARAELARTVAELARPLTPDATQLCSPLFVPDRRGLEDVLRAADPLPASLAAIVGDAVGALLERSFDTTAASAPAPQRVEPGSLGAWSTPQR
jgi:hypothetical protein